MAGWIISIPFIIGASICVYYFLNCILLRRSFEIGVSNTKKTNQAAILFFFLIITPQIYQFTVIKYIEPIYYQGDTYCEQLLNWEELMDKEDKIQNQN